MIPTQVARVRWLKAYSKPMTSPHCVGGGSTRYQFTRESGSDVSVLQRFAYLGDLSSAVVPTLSSTTAASSITGTTASSGGVISNDGGASVTAIGVAWGTSTGPLLYWIAIRLTVQAQVLSRVA